MPYENCVTDYHRRRRRSRTRSRSRSYIERERERHHKRHKQRHSRSRSRSHTPAARKHYSRSSREHSGSHTPTHKRRASRDLERRHKSGHQHRHNQQVDASSSMHSEGKHQRRSRSQKRARTRTRSRSRSGGRGREWRQDGPSTPSTSSSGGDDTQTLQPDAEPVDKTRIHREIEEKLRQTLAKEGKVYPPPKQEASHPVFANDGSFMEIFKKMQSQYVQPAAATATSIGPSASSGAPMTAKAAAAQAQLPAIAAGAVSQTNASFIAATAMGKSAPPPPIICGRRRGGKVLKTGVVAKPKTQDGDKPADPKDFWSIYLAEVNKYKSHACESDGGKRPLVNAKSNDNGDMSTIELKTAPFDPRFPNQNQTRYCYQSYLDYHRCQKKRGTKHEPCNYFLKVYKSMCPNEWVEKWDNQRESGTFPGRI